MAQLWGGRFTKKTDQMVYDFNASISFDKRLYRQDIEGSMAHVRMLAKQQILTDQERDQILEGLTGILADVESGALQITSEYEDIHSFVEANLIDRIGDVGKKLHTGRSRNVQVALDMRLYVRGEVQHTDHLLRELLKVLHRIMEENIDTFMPGFTHLQKAQPVTLAHHVGAYFEMFTRDRSRLKDIYETNELLPARRRRTGRHDLSARPRYIWQLLGFAGPTRNSMDSVSDRDYVIEYLCRTGDGHDAPEPFLRGDHYLELQRVSLCGAGRRLQHRAAASCRRKRTRISQSWYAARPAVSTAHSWAF